MPDILDLDQAIQLCAFDVKFKNLLRKLNDKKLAECYFFLSKYLIFFFNISFFCPFLKQIRYYYALQDYGQAIRYAQAAHQATTALTAGDDEDRERGAASPREVRGSRARIFFFLYLLFGFCVWVRFRFWFWIGFGFVFFILFHLCVCVFYFVILFPLSFHFHCHFHCHFISIVISFPLSPA
jgi:hypothetical protein